MEVIPVINCPDAECIEKKVRVAEGFSKWVHLDVADARFTFGKSGCAPEEWRAFNARIHPHTKRGWTPLAHNEENPRSGVGLKLEVHLMVEEPERAVPLWLAAGAQRVIIHIEALIDPMHRSGSSINSTPLIREMRSQCASHGAALMLAISPETPMEKVTPFISSFSEFQILAVHAGPPGQAFLPLSLQKIQFLRRWSPHARIEVDGGINLITAAQVKDVGATVVAAGTSIFSHADPRGEYRKFGNV
jgi:ribulose-phosphate 3-epimerase